MVNIPSFNTLNSSDTLLSRVQSSIKTVLDFLVGQPASSRQLLEGVVLKSGSNTINHSLGQIPTGYYIVKSSANVNVWNTVTPTKSILTLQSSGIATVSIMVF